MGQISLLNFAPYTEEYFMAWNKSTRTPCRYGCGKKTKVVEQLHHREHWEACQKANLTIKRRSNTNILITSRIAYSWMTMTNDQNHPHLLPIWQIWHDHIYSDSGDNYWIIIDQWSPILQHCQQIVSARFVGLEKSLCSKDRVETPEDHHNYNYDYDYDYLEHQKIYEKWTLTKAKLSLAYFKTASSKIGSWLKIFK